MFIFISTSEKHSICCYHAEKFFECAYTFSSHEAIKQRHTLSISFGRILKSSTEKIEYFETLSSRIKHESRNVYRAVTVDVNVLRFIFFLGLCPWLRFDRIRIRITKTIYRIASSAILQGIGRKIL